MSLQDLAIDPKLELEGYWSEVGEMSFKLLRGGCKKAKRLVQKVYLEELNTLRPGTKGNSKGKKNTKTKEKEEDLTDALFVVEEKAELEVLIDVLLVDWKGVKLSEGDKEEIPYSKEKAREILTDPQYIVLKDFLLLQADSIENFRQEEIIEAGKP